MATFEDFHIVGNREISDRIAAVLRSEGVRLQERVSTDTRPEYVIAVHTDDLERAADIFQAGVDPGRTFTSSAELGAEAERGLSSDS